MRPANCPVPATLPSPGSVSHGSGSGVGLRRGAQGRRAASLYRILGPFLLAPVLTSCGDGTPTLFPEVHHVEVDGAEGLQGLAGEPLPDGLVVVVRDRFGNGLSGLPVTLGVVDGGGTLGEPTRVTDRSGEIRIRDWRMGERPGPNKLRIQVEGVEPVTVEVASGPGVPHELVFLSELHGEWEVASTLTGLPRVRIRDRFGNLVPGLEVDFVPSQGGAVAGGSSLTGSDGTAATPDWVLSPQAGSQFLMARHENRLVAFLRVAAHPGPPVRGGFETPLEQRVEVGLYLPHPPMVRVTDIHGNGIPGMPVAVAVVEGGGRVESWEEETDSLGRARVNRWYMGPEPGTNRLEARVTGLPSALLLAHGVPPDAEPEGRYFRVARLHVNQANQSPAGSLPLIQGRPGLLRVWVTASEPLAPAPPVRIRVYRNGNLVQEVTRQAPTNFLPTSVGPDALAPSYDVQLQGAWMGPGLRVEVDVDPEYEVGVVTRRTGFLVQMEGEEHFSTVSPGPFRIRFVPLRDSVSGVQGVITQDQLDAFMDQTRRMLPLAEDLPSLGDPFVVSLFGSDGRVRSVLSIMRSAWLMSDFRDHYMHGIFPADVPRSFSGIAYRPSNPLNPAPIAMTIDRLPGASFTVAHELGHNLGIRHAPCGDPAGVDPNYPYVNARLGHPGYDYVEHRMMAPNTYYDLMSYCSPRWISDYNFQLMLSWRLAAEPMAGPSAVGMAAASPQPGLLVWGRVGPGGMTLEPALPVDVPPFLPAVEGPYRVRGLDAEGRELFGFRFQPDEVEDGPEPGEMDFAWVVPMREDLRDRLVRLELHGPGGGPGGHVSPEGPPSSDPSQDSAVRLEQGVALEWDPAVFPMAWVRNPASGQVVGMVESGRVDLSLWSHEVEVLLTDGIRGWIPGPDGRVRPGSW
jgi:hypothetical protein